MTRLVVAGPVGTITIDNAAVRNALDDRTRGALLAALRQAATDPACRAIVVTGAGGTFCAGGDVASMPTEEDAIRRRMGELHDIVRLVHAGPKPVAVAVEGAAFGSGLSLSAASDHVVAADNARFGCAFGRLGLLADTGLLWTLRGRVGPARARAIALTNAVISAPEANAIGLVDDLCPPGEAYARAVEWAAIFAHTAPLAVAATRAVLADPGASLNELLAAELQVQTRLLQTDDFNEGRAAFLERRSPRFTGGFERLESGNDS